jgi:AcrR family transcriptional regulator
MNGKENGNETKSRILQAAQELFFSYGIRSITMDDIARHLSISKKTIYQFFEDKDQIVGELCGSISTRMER